MIKRVVKRLRAIGRRLEPPGNRQQLDETYRMPSMDPEHMPSGEHLGPLKENR